MNTKKKFNANPKSSIEWGRKKEWKALVLCFFLAGFLANIPTLFSIDPEWFVPRNIGLIIFLPLLLFVIWQQKTPAKKVLFSLAIVTLGAAYINFLPGDENNVLFVLVCLHMPVVFWGVFSYVALDAKWLSNPKRVTWLRFNGDLLLLIGLIILGGVLFSVLTVSLFEIVQINFASFYFEKIVPWSIAPVPVLAHFLLLHNKSLVQKISRLIATLFTPFAFLTLLLFSLTLPFAKNTLFEDRNLLLLFNIILFAVLALIIFSLSDPKNNKKKVWTMLLSALALLTLINNLLALWAVCIRLLDGVISPNRLAILGLNILAVLHLGFILGALIKMLKTGNKGQTIENQIGRFIPFYVFWALVVAFLFPLAF